MNHSNISSVYCIGHHQSHTQLAPCGVCAFACACSFATRNGRGSAGLSSCSAHNPSQRLSRIAAIAANFAPRFGSSRVVGLSSPPRVLLPLDEPLAAAETTVCSCAAGSAAAPSGSTFRRESTRMSKTDSRRKTRAGGSPGRCVRPGRWASGPRDASNERVRSGPGMMDVGARRLAASIAALRSLSLRAAADGCIASGGG